MDATLTGFGLPGLFALSFLAATLLPLGSEWLLGLLLLEGLDPVACVLVASSGNTLGALTTWGIGLWGGPLLFERWLRIDAAARGRAGRWFARIGSWALLFSWLPLLGDALCLVAGLLRVGFVRCLLLVALGKAARYVAVAWLVLEGGRLLA